jgi:hypothetical protein
MQIQLEGTPPQVTQALILLKFWLSPVLLTAADVPPRQQVHGLI